MRWYCFQQCPLVGVFVNTITQTVAMGSWHWIHQVAAPCNVARGSGWHPIEFAQTSAIWNYTTGFDFDHITAINMSLRTSLQIQIGSPSAEKKMTSYRFSRWRISAILDFTGPTMGSLKCPCTTSCRSSIKSIALNCLVFEILATETNKQTDRQTDGQAHRIRRSRCRKRQLNKYVQGEKIIQNGCIPMHCSALVMI